MLKLFRMIKILKLVKNKERIKAQMAKSLQINSGVERLTSLMFLMIFSEHIFACFWLIIGCEEGQYFRDAWLSPAVKSMSAVE